MTEREAIDYFNNVIIDRSMGLKNMTDTTEIINISINALEKQIPKKIVKSTTANGKCNRECPNGCQITIATMYADINYCPYCGQAVKWDD